MSYQQGSQPQWPPQQAQQPQTWYPPNPGWPPSQTGNISPQQPQPQWGQQALPQYVPSQQFQQVPFQPAKNRVFRKKIGVPLWAIILTLLIVLVLAANVGSKSSSQDTTQNSSTDTIQNQGAIAQPTEAPTQAPTQASTTNPTQVPTPKPTAKPAPTYPQFGDGTYQVGKDIQSGTYRTHVASPGCYYARLKGFGGAVDDIIANNNTDAPAIVTIAVADKGFTSQNCGAWTKDLSQITTSKTIFGDGMYIVGTDITPGTYRNTGAQGCYFARLSGFGNTTYDIIANDNVDTPTIMTIAPSDKGFQSNGCGTWTKQ